MEAPDPLHRPACLAPARKNVLGPGAVAAICLSFVVLLASPIVLIGIHGWYKFKQRARGSEVHYQLDRIRKGAIVYYNAPHVDRDGNALPCQFPASVGLTPAETCCGSLGSPADRDGDERCDADADAWKTPTWTALSHEIDDPHYFVYGFESNGRTGYDAEATAYASGDLDCDGERSSFRWRIVPDPDSPPDDCTVKSGIYLRSEDETE
jgi:hypothetical protein